MNQTFRRVGILFSNTLLAIQGSLARTRLQSGEQALILQIDLIERYAGSVLVAARDNPRGVPALQESLLMSKDMKFPGLTASLRMPRLQERIILECLIQLFVEHGICIEHNGLLVFPALFRPTEISMGDTFKKPVSLCYDFAGAIDNIYSSLVSYIAVSGEFGAVRLWQNRAEFSLPDGSSYGLRKVERHRGFAHLDIYFDDRGQNAKGPVFINLIEEHVQEHGVDILERIEVTCACGFSFDEETLRLRVAEGHNDVGCPACDSRVPISGGVRVARERNPELRRRTWALRTEAKQKRVVAVERVRKNLMRAQDIAADKAAPIRILHLSDLHFTINTDCKSLLHPLIKDIEDPNDGLGHQKLDYLVISGDVSNTGNPREFQIAREFVGELIDRFSLNPERLIVVPGNHDLSWDVEVYNWHHKRKLRDGDIEIGSHVPQGDGYLVRNDDIYATRFLNFSQHFYHPLIQTPYPMLPDRQAVDYLFTEDRIQFIALNSAWQIDEYFKNRSGINQRGLMRGLEAVDKSFRSSTNTGEKVLRIAVWHHPVIPTPAARDSRGGFPDAALV